MTAEARFFDAAQVGDIPVVTGYDGPGQDRVRFTMYLR